MHIETITSFRRAMAAAPIAGQPSGALPVHPVDKWDILRDLAIARMRFDLSDRDLAVLQALLSFHPGTRLDDPGKLIVFPSNTTLCARLNGMPCSTMRRHLSRLIEAGLIARRDSPNGKRYRRREGLAFGFDLTPLACLGAQIRRLAAEVQAEQHRIRLAREQVSLLRRDLSALLAEAGETEFDALPDMTVKALRRKLSLSQLESLREMLAAAVEKLARPATITADLSSTDSQNEQHQYNTNKKNPDSDDDIADTADITLVEVIDTCDELKSFADEPIRDWMALIRNAERLRPMMGICDAVWHQAVTQMGKVAAAVTLAAILQRFDRIRVPAAYLRDLATKAARGEFSAARMIRNLSMESSQL